MTRRSKAGAAQHRADVFRLMFDSHFQRVLRYIEGQVRDRATAEDIAAEVFSVAWQKLDAREPFGLPWLMRTALHRVHDHHRREYRKASVLRTVERMVEAAVEPTEQLDILALHEALEKLPSRDLEVIRLTYWHGLSAGEVAAVLRVNPGAIWTRLYRARERLRTLMGVQQRAGDLDE